MNTPNIDYPGPVAEFLFTGIKVNPSVAGIIWSFACVAFCVVIYYFAVVKQRGHSVSKAETPWWEMGIVLFGVFLLRLPYLILPEQNVDESQWIANAGTFYNGAVLWKHVTGYSGGPLLFVPLCILNVLQLGLSYASVRLFGLLFCVLPSIWIVWLLFKKIFNASVALLLVAPLALFFAFAYTFDMIAYNSEHVPMLLIAISIYLLFTLRNDLAGFDWKPIALGLVLGLFPWAKLQAIPIAFTIGVLALIDILTSKQIDGKRKVTSAMRLVVAALIPSLLFFVYLISNGAVQAFYDDYILGNLLYAGTGMGDHRSGIGRFFVFIPMFRNTHDARLLYVSLALLLTIAFVGQFIFGRIATLRDKSTVYSSLIAAAALFTVTVPGNANLFHYQILFVVPAAVFTGICVGRMSQANDFVYSKPFKLLYALVLIIPLSWTLKEGNRGTAFVNNGGNFNASETSKAIKRYSEPNEKMSVWGWAGKYHVETGLVQGHAQPHPHVMIFESHDNNPRLDAYVAELKESKPAVFLDAVAPTSFFYRTPEFRHDHYPTLRDYIHEQYTLVSDDEGRRVYVRNDKIVKPLLHRPQ